MEGTDVVFIALAYRDGSDLFELIKSIETKLNADYRIIIVNNYYDEESRLSIQGIAEKYGCVFINVPNRGYGSGNNTGIRYAVKNYNFKYITICNPDTEIIAFDFENIKDQDEFIIAPEIVTLNKKKQNPFRVIDIKLLDTIKYFAFKTNKLQLIYIDIVINKALKVCLRIFHRLMRRQYYSIYSCHGSFLMLGKKVVDKIIEPYNEKMFLFSEEDHLAKLAKLHKIKTIFNPNIKVLHKEDGSIDFDNSKVMNITRESYIEYYHYWYGDKNKR